MRDAKRIVVHGGGAHADEVVSAMLAIARVPITRIDRRDPTEEELKDPSVLVLDVGMRYEPGLNNFDHHQLGRDEEPECALSLFARHLMLNDQPAHKMLLLTKWYEPLVRMDVTGPFQLSQHLGTTVDVVLGLQSPLSQGLVRLFESREVWTEGDPLFRILREMGAALLSFLDKMMERQKELTQHVHLVHVEGVPGLVLESDNTEGMGLWREQNAPGTAFSLSHDDRGEGWSLYRFDDDARVNFGVLEGREDILFASNRGFIAKTLKRVGLDELKLIVAKGLVSQ